jgi:hypothetical protein
MRLHAFTPRKANEKGGGGKDNAIMRLYARGLL